MARISSIEFEVSVAGDPAAGIPDYWDRLTISSEAGDLGDEEVVKEFTEYMRQALANWYQGGRVTITGYKED